MTGTRRQVERVVARGVIRALAFGAICSTLGSMLALGCALAWLRANGADLFAVWMIATAAGAQFLGGLAALIAYGWAR